MSSHTGFRARKRRGDRALGRALQLLRSWGFNPQLSGVEFTTPPGELDDLHRDPRELTREELRRRFAPDLRIQALIEVKSVKNLAAPIVPAWELLTHLELAARGEAIVYLFVDSAGHYEWAPLSRLRLEVLFVTNPSDAEFFAGKFPGIDVVVLKQTGGSGQPFIKCRLS